MVPDSLQPLSKRVLQDSFRPRNFSRLTNLSFESVRSFPDKFRVVSAVDFLRRERSFRKPLAPMEFPDKSKFRSWWFLFLLWAAFNCAASAKAPRDPILVLDKFSEMREGITLWIRVGVSLPSSL